MNTRAWCLILLASAISASSMANERDPCRGGKQVDRVAVFLSERVLLPPPGLPLDDALRAAHEAVDDARESARQYFQRSPRLNHLRERFTFLYPPSLQEALGVPVALSPSAVAIRFRGLLWRQYIDRFTEVEEAPGKSADVVRFKVSLDLRLFCRYRQEIRDLVSR